MLLTQLYEQFKAQNRKLRAIQTDKVYRTALRQLALSIGRAPRLADLTDQSLIALEKYLTGRSAYTVNERTGRIKTLWRYAADQGLVRTRPTLGRLPVDEPCRRAWSVAEVRQLLKACERVSGDYSGVPRCLWWRVFHLLLWDTGERTGAARAVRFDWLSNCGLSIPAVSRKGRKSAFYRLSPMTLTAIDGIRQPARPLVFPFEFSDATFYLHYAKLLRTAGLPATRKDKPQKMRRTHLTLWAVGGGDPAARAQHSSRAVTERFYLDESQLPQPSPQDFLPEL